MVDVDWTKVGRIPNGGGWRAHGRNSEKARAAARSKTKTGGTAETGRRGYVYLHSKSGARGSVWRQLLNHTEPRVSDQEPSISFCTSDGISLPERTAKSVAVFGVSPMAMATLGEIPSTS